MSHGGLSFFCLFSSDLHQCRGDEWGDQSGCDGFADSVGCNDASQHFQQVGRIDIQGCGVFIAIEKGDESQYKHCVGQGSQNGSGDHPDFFLFAFQESMENKSCHKPDHDARNDCDDRIGPEQQIQWGSRQCVGRDYARQAPDESDKHAVLRAHPRIGELPIVFGSTWEAGIAGEIGATLVEISYPVTDEVVLSRSYIGYRGALQLIERTYTTVVRQSTEENPEVAAL